VAYTEARDIKGVVGISYGALSVLAQQNAMHPCTAGHNIFHLNHLIHMKSSASLGWGWHASAQPPRRGAVAGGPAQRMRAWPSQPQGHPRVSSLRLLLQQPCLQISYPTCCPGRHPAWTPKLPAASISRSSKPQHPSMPRQSAFCNLPCKWQTNK